MRTRRSAIPTALVVGAAALAAACGSGSAASETCADGDACTCASGNSGTEVCRPDGSFAACVCDGDPAACIAPSQEWCDGRDNDCNGMIDDGEACPDPAVSNTMPFAAGVYIAGSVGQSFCPEVLQRIQPALDPSYIDGLICFGWYHFRRSDGALFYSGLFDSIHQHTATGNVDVATPPCGAEVAQRFDFDASGALYYRCGDAIWKSGGTMVARPVLDLIAVLDDGRIIATRSGTDGLAYVVIGAGGDELSRLSLHGAYTGTLEPVADAATVAGDRAYVAFLRTYAIRQTELVVFRVDESSAWARVRRVPLITRDPNIALLALPDGTVLMREHDPDNPQEVTQRVMALAPDGTRAGVWHDYDLGAVHGNATGQLLVGPP